MFRSTPLPSFRSTLIALACTAGLSAPALAAPGQMGHHCQNAGALTVSGQGQSRIAPDLAVVSLGVTTQADTASQAMAENSERQNAVIEALKGAGIEDADIQTSGLTLNPMMNYPEDGTPPSISGYMAQNLLTVKVTDISGLGEVLDKIVNSGANEMRGISFIREDSRTVEDQALTDAVAEATHRAEVIAKAAGKTLGPIIHIGEPQSQQSRAMMMMDAALSTASAEAKSVPVEGGEVAFNSVVEVTYALANEDGQCDSPRDMKRPHGKDGAGKKREKAPKPTDDAMQQDPAPGVAQPEDTMPAEVAAPDAATDADSTPEADASESTLPSEVTTPVVDEAAVDEAPASN